MNINFKSKNVGFGKINVLVNDDKTFKFSDIGSNFIKCTDFKFYMDSKQRQYMPFGNYFTLISILLYVLYPNLIVNI